jgi:hypothetical protein
MKKMPSQNFLVTTHNNKYFKIKKQTEINKPNSHSNTIAWQPCLRGIASAG